MSLWAKPAVTPPAERPRLLMRAGDKPMLKMRIEHPDMRKLAGRLHYFASFPLDKLQAWDAPDAAFVLEANALLYALNDDEEAGRKAKALAMTAVTRKFNSNYQDISREIGRLMLAGAVVYDWCYELFDEQERSHMIAHFKRLAGLLECGYPPDHEGAFVGHTSEWMLMRDLIGTGIAIYEEDPEMYDLAAGRFFAEFVPARNFFYPSGWHHQGDNYGSFRYQCELFATLLFAKMGHDGVFDPSQEKVGYQWLYSRRPDGKLLRDGDTDNPLYEENRYIKLFPLVYLMAGNYYNNGYFLDQQLREHPDMPDFYVFHAFLFHDPALQRKPLRELPLTRYFAEPAGIMVARTGWDEGIDKQSSTVVAEMKIGMYQYNNHQHLDAGSFQIYYKGYLAIDSGIYKGSSGKYHSPHNKYYFKRTIAHNAMLVHDPDELKRHPFITDGGLMWPNVNDGGQRWPNNGRPAKHLEQLLGGEFQRGKVLAHAYGPDEAAPAFSYLKGDITAAYSQKVSKHTRSFVFLNLQKQGVPAVLIVYDDIVSVQPEFVKTWLLHSIEEPAVAGRRTVIARTEDGYGGELAVDTLLPEQAVIGKVGGPGQEFAVGGTNYANDAAGFVEQGSWRIEVRPEQASREDRFLHAIQIKDHDGSEAPAAVRVDCGNMTGVYVQDWVVMFSCSGGLIGGTVHMEVPDSAGPLNMLVTDLQDGVWQVNQEQELPSSDTEQLNGTLIQTNNGTLHLQGVNGGIRLTRMGENQGA
ncbi:heparin/heparin-sulfate lyase HepB [Paenibacillus thalictri]|uniref:Heparinase n=1 Tax=Paenibacillus thalictri TaxID=2527873 RepID=A0A4Q9DSQ0_9BACL|nr:heparin/heparin-sulfate lyase HepB [Paenibacillus thalictri]TBL78995.1 heparinase [Paenibacillus thalictri]